MTLDEMIREFKYSAAEYESKLKGLREKDVRTYTTMKAAANKLRLCEGWLKELKYLRKQMQQDTNVIRSCPFCGKTPVTVVDDETEEKFGVKCFNCGGSIYPEKETLAEAIEAWNRRMNDGRFDQPAAGN